MKIRMLFLIPLLLLLSIPLFAQTSVVWDSDGWKITSSYKNPNPTAGTAVNVSFAITYTIDGTPMTQAGTETIPLPVQANVIKKIYTSSAALNTQYTVQNVTGDGSAAFDTASGKLVFSINAPNDGALHTVVFKLKSTLPGWIVRIPWLRNWFMDKPVIVG